MVKFSRSGVEKFLSCKRCFVLYYKHKIYPPSLPFTLNSAVDNLCKNEFDYYRDKGLPHPIFEQYAIDAVPFKHSKMDEWRNNFKGAYYTDIFGAYKFGGSVDDLDNLRGKYSPKSKPNLTDDHLYRVIVELREKLPKWKWALGALYVWGVRPSEVFSLTPNEGDLYGTANVLGLKEEGEGFEERTALGCPTHLIEEFELMKQDIVKFKEMGCKGIVSGVLNNDKSIDIERTKELVELSKPLEFTFHRAFDIVSRNACKLFK